MSWLRRRFEAEPLEDARLERLQGREQLTQLLELRVGQLAHVEGRFGPRRRLGRALTIWRFSHGHHAAGRSFTEKPFADIIRADLYFHDLRHEAGSRKLEAGWPLHAVSAFLGHANVTTAGRVT